MIDTNLTWADVISVEKNKDYFKDTLKFVENERALGKVIYPEKQNVFNAFKLSPFNKVKVVILGQDPYHGPNQAHGLAFSVEGNVAVPPSLKNIYKEIHTDLGLPIPSHGNLTHWAEQGVFLLNTVLTVEQAKAHSHANKGWETFTDNVIKTINQYHKSVVYMLWGSNAHKKIPMIDQSQNLILKTAHPSPLSAYRGFLGSKQFSQCNNYIESKSAQVIDWKVI
jgi:uracil-DNA glycosylase